MSSRKRSGSGSKRPKEKVVYIYEMIFRTDFKDPTKTNPEFWHEFFLLQPNVDILGNDFSAILHLMHYAYRFYLLELELQLNRRVFFNSYYQNLVKFE